MPPKDEVVEAVWIGLWFPAKWDGANWFKSSESGWEKTLTPIEWRKKND